MTAWLRRLGRGEGEEERGEKGRERRQREKREGTRGARQGEEAGGKGQEKEGGEGQGRIRGAERKEDEGGNGKEKGRKRVRDGTGRERQGTDGIAGERVGGETRRSTNLLTNDIARVERLSIEDEVAEQVRGHASYGVPAVSRVATVYTEHPTQ